jgi:hypothetical protein
MYSNSCTGAIECHDDISFGHSLREDLHRLKVEASSLCVETQSSLNRLLHKKPLGVSRVKASVRFVIEPVELSYVKSLDQFRTWDDICQNTPRVTRVVKTHNCVHGKY